MGEIISVFWIGENVYISFNILLFISKHKVFRGYWFETGTPGFLIKLFQKNNYLLPDLEEIEAGEELLSLFEIEISGLQRFLSNYMMGTSKYLIRCFSSFFFLHTSSPKSS